MQFQFIPGVLSTAELLTPKVIPVLIWEAVIFSPFLSTPSGAQSGYGGDNKIVKFRGLQRIGSRNIHIRCILFTPIATLSPVGFSTFDVSLYSLWNIGLASSLQVDN